MMRQSQSGKRTVRFLHVDTTQLDLNHEFQLSKVEPPNAFSPDEPFYKLKKQDRPSQREVGKNIKFYVIQPSSPSEWKLLSPVLVA